MVKMKRKESSIIVVGKYLRRIRKKKENISCWKTFNEEENLYEESCLYIIFNRAYMAWLTTEEEAHFNVQRQWGRHVMAFSVEMV